MVRHLLGRRGEAGFLAEIAGDWPHLFPRLPQQCETNRPTRLSAPTIVGCLWLWQQRRRVSRWCGRR
jgi:hypothetical protein